jgi:hypothetical protein
MVGLSVNAVASAYAVGAAFLGLWLYARFPAFGPRSLRAALALVACAYCVLLAAGPATGAVKTLAGPVPALACVVLPIFTFAFWTGIQMLRATIGAFDRSGS